MITFSLLVSMFPDSGDDWAWGSQIGFDRLETKFDNYNGRWAGNLMVMTLTRSKLMDILFTAISLVCVCLFPKIFANTKSFVPYAFGALLLLLIPQQILVQSIVWTAGFTNYVPPILMTVLYFLLIKNIFESDHPRYHWSIAILSAVLGFISALFMENVTLYNIFISVVIIGFAFIKFKHIYITHIAHLVGSIGGAAVMFSNSVYRSIANGTDSYRSTAQTEGLIKTITEHTNVIFQQFFRNNMAVFIILSILCVIAYVMYASSAKNNLLKNISLTAVLVNIFTCLIMFAKKNYYYWFFAVGHAKSQDISIYAFAAVAVIYCLSVLAIVLICVTSHEYKFKILLLLVSVPVLVAPLLIVNPIGPRCFFPPFFTLIAACVVLFAYIQGELKLSNEMKKGLAVSFAAGTLAMLVFYLSIYSVVHSYDAKRNEYAQKQVEAGYSTIKMCELPYGAYVWMPDPKADLWAYRYKLFHNIDQEVKFEFVNYLEYNKWLDQFSQEVK